MSFEAPQGQQDVNPASAPSGVQTSDVNPTTAEPSQSASPDAKPQADSSSAPGVKQEGSKSLSDMIKSGLAKITGKDQAETPPVDPAKTPETKQVTEEKKLENQDEEAVSEEEKAAPTEIQNHPAFKKVVNERTQARRQRNQALKEIETYKGDASRYQNIQTFLQREGVPQQDAADALKYAAMWRSDPQALYDKLGEMRQQLGQQLGHILPKDLQDEVDQGLITEQRASELAKARGTVTATSEQLKQTGQQMQVQQQQAELDHRVKLYTNWANQVSQTDPGLQAKLPLITDRMNAILQKEGNPKDTQDAWNRLNRAYKEVNDRIKGFTPAKPNTNPTPRSGGVVVSSATAPSNIDEAFQSAFSNIRTKKQG